MKRRGDDGRGAVHLAALGPVRTLRIRLGNETHMYVYSIHIHKDMYQHCEIALCMYVI